VSAPQCKTKYIIQKQQKDSSQMWQSNKSKLCLWRNYGQIKSGPIMLPHTSENFVFTIQKKSIQNNVLKASNFTCIFVKHGTWCPTLREDHRWMMFKKWWCEEYLGVKERKWKDNGKHVIIRTFVTFDTMQYIIFLFIKKSTTCTHKAHKKYTYNFTSYMFQQWTVHSA